ncbi:MAG: hypothetical protein AB1896_01815 [Thermodesulfobacteriota bacterium]
MNKDVIQKGGLTFVPVLHGRLEFAEALRRVFRCVQPTAVAVELPVTLQKAVERGLDRLPLISVVLYQEKNGRTVYLPLEPHDPVVAAAHLARAAGLPLAFIDRDTEGYPRRREPFPDPYTVTRLGLAVYAEAYRQVAGRKESAREDLLREMTLAYHLQELGRKYERVLCVLGLAHYPAVRRLLETPQVLPLGRARREGVTLARLAEESCREILSEPAFLAAAFVRSGEDYQDQNQGRPAGTELDRLALYRVLLDQAREKHLHNSKEEVTTTQLAVLFKFARNYALVQGHLTPDLYQLLVASRGTVDDNFAYEVWDLATTYPWQDPESALPELRLKGEDLFLDTKKIKFYRRFRHFRRRLVAVPIKKRKREKKPGEWKEGWQGRNICSYQPEDIVIEGFGDYLRKKTLKVLSEENRRTMPFSTTLLDGIDLRETIRNWHEGRLYVFENRQVRGKVGSVVLIYDYDETAEGGEEKYPWHMSWLGEHNQESDMAFYSTPAGEQVMGPGISKCEYGGFMMTYPPLRLYDIWRDPFFDLARTKAERLLLAGIDYSEEKLVAYIAPKPPPDRIKNWANLYGKKVVFIPLGQFSPVTLKRIRTFHVLDGHRVRGWAGEYIY